MSACVSAEAPAAELAAVRERAARLTHGLLGGAAGASLALYAAAGELALLPAAFVLGWLNLVGL